MFGIWYESYCLSTKGGDGIVFKIEKCRICAVKNTKTTRPFVVGRLSLGSVKTGRNCCWGSIKLVDFNAVLLCSKYMLMFKMKAKKVCMVVEKKR